MVPREFETCDIATIFVFLVIKVLKTDKFNSPSLLMGTTFKLAPLCSQHNCQGTIFEWCSSSEIIISSFLLNCLLYEFATMLIESVVPLVKIISLESRAPIKLFIFNRVSSSFFVAKALRKCAPLCTLEFSYL